MQQFTELTIQKAKIDTLQKELLTKLNAVRAEIDAFEDRRKGIQVSLFVVASAEKGLIIGYRIKLRRRSVADSLLKKTRLIMRANLRKKMQR